MGRSERDDATEEEASSCDFAELVSDVVTTEVWVFGIVAVGVSLGFASESIRLKLQSQLIYRKCEVKQNQHVTGPLHLHG